MDREFTNSEREAIQEATRILLKSKKIKAKELKTSRSLKSIAVKVAIVSSLVFTVGSIASQFKAKSLPVKPGALCPLYAMDELQKTESKLNWTKKVLLDERESKKELETQLERMRLRLEQEKLEKAYLVPISNYSRPLNGQRNNFKNFSKYDRWKQKIVYPVIEFATNRGIPEHKAKLIIAHAKLENGTNPNPPGLNIWNIKGKGQKLKTIEYYKGRKCSVVDSFRTYQSVNEAAKDYLSFLERNYPKAYKALLDDKQGLDDFLKGLDRGKYGRYATDINYHHKFKSAYRQIERGIV